MNGDEVLDVGGDDLGDVDRVDGMAVLLGLGQHELDRVPTADDGVDAIAGRHHLLVLDLPFESPTHHGTGYPCSRGRVKTPVNEICRLVDHIDGGIVPRERTPCQAKTTTITTSRTASTTPPTSTPMAGSYLWGAPPTHSIGRHRHPGSLYRMSVDTVSTFLAVGALILLACVVAIWVVCLLALVSSRARRVFDSIRLSVDGQGLWLAWAMAAIAMAGSLYYSEVAGFPPCEYCWYQRIAMYPLVVILGIAMVRRDYGIRRYVLPLASIGDSSRCITTGSSASRTCRSVNATR